MNQILSVLPKIPDKNKNIIKTVFYEMSYQDEPQYIDLVKKWLSSREFCSGTYVDGKWVDGELTYDVNHKEKKLYRINFANVEALAGILKSACRYSKYWQSINDSERNTIIKNVIGGVENNLPLFIALEKLNSPTVISERRKLDALPVVQHLHSLFDYAIAYRNENPIGTVAVIRKPNDPSLMSAFCNIITTFLFKNTVILFPCVDSCLTSLLFAEICHKSGVPPGVLTVLPYQNEVDCMKFLEGLTSSELLPLGELKIQSNYICPELWIKFKSNLKLLNIDFSSSYLTPVTIIVFEDADLTSAVGNILDSFHSSVGMDYFCQIFIQDSVKCKVLQKIELELKKLNIKKTNKFKIEEIVENLPIGYGAQELGEGLYAFSFRTIKEAVEMFNHAKTYGEVYLWTEGITLAHEIIHKLKSKSVWINCQTNVTSEIYSSSEADELYQAHTKPNINSIILLEDCRDFNTFGEDTVDNITDLKNQKISADTFQLFYGGCYHTAKSEKFLPIPNKNGDIIGYVPYATQVDVFAAIEAAKVGQEKWKNMTITQRSKLLLNIAVKLKAQSNLFVDLLKLQNPSRNDSECQKEVESSISVLYDLASYLNSHGEGIIYHSKGAMIIESNESLGVIGILCDDKLPLLEFISLWSKAAIFGNTVVIIPSTEHPIPALQMCQIFLSCNLPNGVVNVICGNPDVLLCHIVHHLAVDNIWLPIGNFTRHAFVQYKAVKLNKKRFNVYELTKITDTDIFRKFATYSKNVCISTYK